ncbi:MAG: hypothetical protein WBX20_11545 [Terrimicrobiaceae bacterium]
MTTPIHKPSSLHYEFSCAYTKATRPEWNATPFWGGLPSALTRMAVELFSSRLNERFAEFLLPKILGEATDVTIMRKVMEWVSTPAK